MSSTSRLIVILFAACLALSPQILTSQSTDPVRLTKGTRLMMDLDTPLNSTVTREGDTVLLRIRNDIKVRDRIAIPRGVVVKATAVRVKPPFVNGKSKHAELHLEVQELLFSNGTTVRLEADALKLESEEFRQSTSNATQSAARQSLPNAVVGGLLAGRTGAIVGVLAGVGLGAVSEIRRPKAAGTDVDLPQGSIIQTSLKRLVDIPASAFSPAAATVGPAALPSASAISVDSGNNVSSISPATSGVPRFEADAVGTSPASPATPPATSASRTPGVFSLSVDVKLVQVDAVVHDRAGKPMTTLQREDFRLFEDGVEQTVQHFSRDELPLAVALVIDRSGSVAPIMDRIQVAAFKALQQLKRGDQVALFAFAGNVELLEGLTADRQRVANSIGTIEPGGGTRIMDAVDEALRYLQVNARDRRRAVILISDNFEIDSRTTLASVVDSALKTEAAVYSVRIRESSRSPFLPGPVVPSPSTSGVAPDRVVLLANETGGEVFDAKTSALDSALATAVSRLKLRYTLGYAPSVRSQPGGYHAIEVRLTDSFGKTGSDYNVFARRGYYE